MWATSLTAAANRVRIARKTLAALLPGQAEKGSEVRMHPQQSREAPLFGQRHERAVGLVPGNNFLHLRFEPLGLLVLPSQLLGDLLKLLRRQQFVQPGVEPSRHRLSVVPIWQRPRRRRPQRLRPRRQLLAARAIVHVTRPCSYAAA
jgi:hypothetical protein